MIKAACTCPPGIKKPPACTIPDCPCSYRGPPPLPFENLFDDELEDERRAIQERKFHESVLAAHNSLLQKTEKEKEKILAKMEARRLRFSNMQERVMMYINNKRDYIREIFNDQKNDFFSEFFDDLEDQSSLQDFKKSQLIISKEYELLNEKIRNGDKYFTNKKQKRQIDQMLQDHYKQFTDLSVMAQMKSPSQEQWKRELKLELLKLGVKSLKEKKREEELEVQREKDKEGEQEQEEMKQSRKSKDKEKLKQEQNV